MLKFFKICVTFILTISSMIGMCVVFSACSNKVNEETVLGKWDDYNGVKLFFADEEAYNDGEIIERKVFPELNCKLGENYYMIVDFDIHAPRNNDGRETVTSIVQIQPATIIAATIQETNTGNVSEETKDDIREIKAIYKVPEKANSVRSMRLVIKVKAMSRGLVKMDITFKSSSFIEAVKTAKIEKSAVMGYTEELEFNKNYLLGVNNKTIKDIIIPSIYNDQYITIIGNNAFKKCSGILSITIPESIKSIGDSAFYGCAGLENITLPDSITSIGNNAFAGCIGLTSITIPQGVTFINNYTFEDCSGLTNITISNSVTGIASYVFLNCIGLKSVSIPSSVNSISSGAFKGCSQLENIKLPNSLTRIGSYIIEGCRGLKSITYNGTKEQWKAMRKDIYWKLNSISNYIVHCEDGDLTKAES